MGFFHFNSFMLFVYYCMMKRLSMPTAHWALPSVLEQEVAPAKLSTTERAGGHTEPWSPSAGVTDNSGLHQRVPEAFLVEEEGNYCTETETLEQAEGACCCTASSPYLSLRETNSLSLSYVPSATFIWPLKPFLI